MYSQKIKGVLWNFLATLASRYSDYQGYWLWGFLVERLATSDFEVDLLSTPPETGDGPAVLAARLSVEKFHDQCRKARVPMSSIRSAWVILTVKSGPAPRLVQGQERVASLIVFKAVVEMTNGSRRERERIEIVAPHDPDVENRSSRATA